MSPKYFALLVVIACSCQRESASPETPLTTTTPATAGSASPNDPTNSPDGGEPSMEQLADLWDTAFANDVAAVASERAVREQEIVDAVAKIETLSMAGPVECRATRCKLMVRADSAKEFEDALGPLLGAPGPKMAATPLLNGPTAITRRVENADGSLTGTIYLGRPGAPFGP